MDVLKKSKQSDNTSPTQTDKERKPEVRSVERTYEFKNGERKYGYVNADNKDEWIVRPIYDEAKRPENGVMKFRNEGEEWQTLTLDGVNKRRRQ